MTLEEHRLLHLRDAEQRASVRTFYAILVIAAILLLAVALISMATTLRYTRDLATLHDAIRDFADSLEGLVQDRTADLSRAKDELQRFAHIISHGLRSPLVNIMGFTAELETLRHDLPADQSRRGNRAGTRDGRGPERGPGAVRRRAAPASAPS